MAAGTLSSEKQTTECRPFSVEGSNTGEPRINVNAGVHSPEVTKVAGAACSIRFRMVRNSCASSDVLS